MYEEPDFVPSGAPFLPHRTKMGQCRWVQQEGRMSKGGKSCPGHAGNSLECLIVKPLGSDSSLQGSWVVTQPKGRRRRVCGPSSCVRQLSLLLRTPGWPVPFVRLGFTAAPKHRACLAHPGGESVYPHLNNLFLNLQLYCLLKGSVRAPEIILVHTHFSPTLVVTVLDFLNFFFEALLQN